MALAAVLRDLAPKFGWDVSWAHLNHALRGAESDADAAFVAEAASRWGVPLELGREDVAELARRRKLSVEAAGRQARYAFLEAAARACGAAFVATAHTADDQAETILLRLMRGAGVRGLRGILPARPILPGSSTTLVRPILSIRRDVVHRFLGARGIPFCTDSSNADPRYARTRARRFLAGEDRSLTERLVRLAAASRRMVECLEPALEAACRQVRGWDQVQAQEGKDEIFLAPLVRLSDPLRYEVLYCLLAASGGPALSRRNLEAFAAFAAGARSGGSFSLPGGLWRHEYDRVVRIRANEEKVFPPLVIERPGRYLWGAWTFEIQTSGDLGESPEGAPLFCFTLRGAELLFPLVIRTRRPGDRFRPRGSPGTRKLGDYWIDLKFPRRWRGVWPLLFRGEKLAAVPGFAVGEAFAAEGPAPCLRVAVWCSDAEIRKACAPRRSATRPSEELTAAVPGGGSPSR